MATNSNNSNGFIFVPYITQYGFISDIDDTIFDLSFRNAIETVACFV
jgi:hypothetical protein